MEQIISNKCNDVKYDREKKIIHYTTFGIINFEVAKETMNAVRSFAETNKVLGVVSDMRDAKGTFTRLNEFIEKEYMPDMIKKGMMCTGMVVSNDVFTQFAANQIITKMGNFTIQTFPSLVDAINWVEKYVSE